MKKRPSAVHFICIETQDWVAIKTSITTSAISHWSGGPSDLLFRPSIPLKAIGLLRGQIFKIKIEGIGHTGEMLFSKVYQSDNRGNFDFKIFKSSWKTTLSRIVVFEIGLYQGLELLLGHFIPLKIDNEKKLLISDFDKTLVDTRYSTTKEMYYSLTRPVSNFPRVDASIHLFKEAVERGYKPFVLSASPHFYEAAIRDWLYQNGIYTAGIFLKDYRIIFSPFEGQLTPKDLKSQGTYKLGSLIQVLLMTGIPDELMLMGDGMESDATIYLSLWMLIKEKLSPWDLWKMIKQEKAFRLSVYQDATLLNKMYQLESLIQQQRSSSCEMSIHIRCMPGGSRPTIGIDFLKKYEGILNYYEGHSHGI